MFYNRTRFSDFAPDEHIASNILSDRLATLERTGLISKKDDEELGNQYIYSMTQKGRHLLPTLVEMFLWGIQYDPKTPASKKLRRSAKRDRRRAAEDIIGSIENLSFFQEGFLP